MSAKTHLGQVQGELVKLFEGLCGAPTNEHEIGVGSMTGTISISWMNFLSKDIPEIKRRLLAYEGIAPETLEIIETREIRH